MKKKFDAYGEVVSHGYGEGFSIILQPYKFYISNRILNNKQERIEELNKFKYYNKKTIQKIKSIQKEFPDSIKELLEIQIYFLKDPVFIEAVEKNILVENKNLSLAIYEGSLTLKKFFQEQASDFMKQRWIDFQDAIQQLLDEVSGISYFEICINKIHENIKDNDNYILVAEDLSPLLYLKIPKPRGILLIEGSLTGHLTLLAMNQGIPILINIIPKDILDKLKDKDWIIIDSYKAKASVFESKTTESKQLTTIYKNYEKKSYYINHINTIISLNVDDIEIIKEHKKNYQLSVGLFRTEFIYLKNPRLLFHVENASQVYFEIYSTLQENDILTLRLIDVDEDKFSYFFYTSPENRNKRGIDYYKSEINILKNQIKSIFMGLNYFNDINWNLKILIPMIASYDDWKFIQEIILNEMNYLKDNIKNKIQFGLMLEIPSIFYDFSNLEDEIDFFSIGTNDLISHFLGKKRNQIIKNDYYEPSIYRMLYMTLKHTKKEISICGNLSTHIDFLPLLYFCGVRNYSIPFGYYNDIYRYFEHFIDIKKYEDYILTEILTSRSKEELKQKLELFKKNYIEITT